MRKYFSLLLLGLAVVLASGCYKKARQAEEDDGTGISNTSKWDWNGEAPLSGIFNGRAIDIGSNYVIEKIQNNQVGLIYMMVKVDHESEDDGSYTLVLQTNLKPGVHISMASLNTINFNLMYTPKQLPVPGQMINVFSTNKLVLKLIKNNDDVAEGYFYGRLTDPNNPSKPPIEIKNAYFKIDKAGTIIQD